MAQYTREEAIEKILQMKKELGHMPTEREYKNDSTTKLEDLEKALDVKGYAALNITVLRELRKRRGVKVNLLDDAEKNNWIVRNDFIINPHKPKAKKKPKMEVKKMEESKKQRVCKHWTKEEVAKIVKKFYDIKSRFPTDAEMRDGTFRTVCEEPMAPSAMTCYKYLGHRRTEWSESIRVILNAEPHDNDLEAAILKKKEADKELISEEEYECYRYMDLAKFFETARAVREMVEDGTLKKIQEAANQLNFETRIYTESDGIKMYFAAQTNE